MAEDAAGPWAANRRQHERVELYATVTFNAADETFILSVSNLSLGGVFLLADGQDLSKVTVGGEHEIAITDGDDPQKEVVVRARVLRREAAGIALKWVGEDDMFKVAELVDLARSAYTPGEDSRKVR